jgi:hypothetical protein
MLFQVQIPVLQQFLFDAAARQALTVVGLYLQVSASIEVRDVTADGLEVLPPLLSTFTMTSGVRRAVRSMSSVSSRDR